MPLQEKTLPGCNPSPWKQSSNDPLQGEAEEATAHTAGSSAAWLSSNRMKRLLVRLVFKDLKDKPGWGGVGGECKETAQGDLLTQTPLRSLGLG